MAKVFYGTIIHSVSVSEIEFISNGLLFVDAQGRVAKLLRNVPQDQLQDGLAGIDLAVAELTVLEDNQFIIPGFVDTHIHASQYSYCGNGHDIPLLEWLDSLTFPHEAKFKDSHYARNIYTRAVARSLRNGTTSACWFATIHLDATKELVRAIHEQGQRAFVGKVNMNQNAPDILIETTESSIADTRAFVEYVNSFNTQLMQDQASDQRSKPLVTPIITPRFAISCTSDLLRGLGKLAAEFDIPIQSHLCENTNEIEFTMSSFPDSTSYTAVYADHGLLTQRSIMAHCVHMKDDEWTLMKDSHAGISHCPSSNFNIKSGMADVRRMIDMDLKVGLGTDVAGGYSCSILDAIRCSRICSIARNPTRSLLIPELFYMATMGGARVMELGDTIGNFNVGMEFDAILVNIAVKGSPIDVFAHDTVQTKFEKYLFVGDDRNNAKVYIQGKEVKLS
ncbi:hypothetical protein BGZ99_004913 [Dissophora globulifera]|uniref:Guanine deaminase n=1 Tax=Dissophora globulifera TaxID=979702 RepID=A0A9P6RST5_9FUNG|nr:hypothetical protein BGZ99_004913 [Dissophora globulifera]